MGMKEVGDCATVSGLPSYRTATVCTVLLTPQDMPTDILRRALATVQGSATDAASPPVLGLSRQHPMLAYDDPTTAPLLPLDPATPVLHQIAGMPREGTGQNLYLVLRVHAQGEQEAASSGVYTGPAPGSPMQTTRHGASILSPSMILGPPGPNGHVHTPGEDAPAGGKEAQPGAFSRLAAGLRSMPAFEDSCSSTEGATQDTSGVAMGGTVGSREHTPPQDGKQKIGRSRMNVEAISFSPGGALPTSVATSVLSPPGPPCAQQDVCDSGGEAYTGSSGLGATASTLQYFDLPSYSNPSPPSMGMGLGMAMGMGMQQGPGLVDLQAYLLQLQAMQVQAYMGGMFGPQSFPGAGTQESGLHVGPGPGLHLPSTQALSHRGNMLYALGSPTGAAPGLGWQGPNAGYISTPMPGRGGYNERLLRETQHMPLRGHPEAEGGTAGQDEGDWQATSSPHQPSRDFGYGRQHGAGAGRSSFPRHASTFISTGLGGGPLQVVPEADMRQQAQKHVWHLQQSLEALQSLIPEHDYEPLSSLVCVPPSASPSGRYEPKPVAIVRGKTLFTTSIRHIDYGSEPVRGLPDVLADIGTITFDKAQRAAQRASASKDTARVAYVEAGAVPVLVELARLLQCRDRTTDTALEFTIQALCNIAYHPTARDVMTRPDSGLLEVICDTMRWNTNLNIALKCARTVDALVWENTVAQQRAAYLGICELAVECIQRHSIDAHAVLNLARMLSAIARTVETLKAVQVAGLEEACEAVKGQQYSEGWEKLVGEHTAAEQARYQRPSPSRLLRQSGGTTQAGARAAAGLHLLLDKANRADSRML